ncbi:MAG: MBL fold metallo-hydrolase [Ruminococcaceae bacterium]|nr:MBL fold metallo-hydrolase [Oscillospiraceae bacterium]
MKIISLLENTTERDDIKIEHGLSLYIETEKHKILFDMGQTDLFFENAKTLGINLEDVDIAVLSHGHYDHGGGLSKFLEINDHAPLYINKDAFLSHYNGTEKYIGLDPNIKSDPRIIFTSDEYVIEDSVALFTCNGRARKYEMLPSGLNEKVNDTFIADDFRHEQYLLIKENGKNILISGCSHKGILDITNWFSPDVLIGGFHYSKLPLDDYLVNAAKELSSYATKFYACHCTGHEQFEFMRQYMPSLHYLSCGQSITV